MYNTHNVDAVAAALLDLMGRMNSPRHDEVLLKAAGVRLDRALFPLLVGLSRSKKISVSALADQVGRDPSTVSRQLAKLESLGMVARPPPGEDLRTREAVITKAGARAILAITQARRFLLGEILREWSAEEREEFARLLQRFADSMKEPRR